MTKKLITTASILGAIAIIFGAFGAHALKNILSSDQLATFETGVRYQMYHALFLLLISAISSLTDSAKKVILTLVQIGVILFSGSIYLLATNDLTTFDYKIIGFVTPIGGGLLIAAWCILIYQNYKKKL